MSGTLVADFAHAMGRDLERLEAQIGLYPDDESLWWVGGDITNPGGTLATHLVGNLEHFIGAELGGSGYVRDRELEFSERGVSRADLQGRVARCREGVLNVLAGLSDADLAEAYPGRLPPVLEGATTRRFLLHLSGHLQWHLGQLDYHRRLLP